MDGEERRGKLWHGFGKSTQPLETRAVAVMVLPGVVARK